MLYFYAAQLNKEENHVVCWNTLAKQGIGCTRHGESKATINFDPAKCLLMFLKPDSRTDPEKARHLIKKMMTRISPNNNGQISAGITDQAPTGCTYRSKSNSGREHSVVTVPAHCLKQFLGIGERHFHLHIVLVCPHLPVCIFQRWASCSSCSYKDSVCHSSK